MPEENETKEAMLAGLYESLDRILECIKEATSEEPEREPCPFCGSGRSSFRVAASWSCVRCLSCTAEGPPANTHKEAVELWNHRD